MTTGLLPLSRIKIPSCTSKQQNLVALETEQLCQHTIFILRN